jgi:hypothetical protein
VPASPRGRPGRWKLAIGGSLAIGHWMLGFQRGGSVAIPRCDLDVEIWDLAAPAGRFRNSNARNEICRNSETFHHYTTTRSFGRAVPHS